MREEASSNRHCDVCHYLVEENMSTPANDEEEDLRHNYEYRCKKKNKQTLSIEANIVTYNNSQSRGKETITYSSKP